MPAVFAQKWNVMQTVEPISVVRHDGAGGAVAEAEEAVEDSANAGLVTLDLGLGQQLARLVLAGGIADLRGAPAHEHDRLVAGALPQPEEHDLHQTAHVQAVRGAIEADVGDGRPFEEARVERLAVGALMHETAGLCGSKERRASDGHSSTMWAVSGRWG